MTSTFAKPHSSDVRKAWWGLLYLGAICAQAGFRCDETPSQADVFSLDAQVFIRSTLSVFVQVKCTSRPITHSRSYAIKSAWRKNWQELDLPGYFVVVSVPADTTDWIDHGARPWTTVQRSAAFWTRIDPLNPSQKSIQVTASQRLTVDTLDIWSADLELARQSFGGRGGTP